MTIFIDKIGFFRQSDPFRFPKCSETVEIVFTDPDLGGLRATDRQKVNFIRLYRAKSRFLGHFMVKNGVFEDPLFGPRFGQKLRFRGF